MFSASAASLTERGRMANPWFRMYAEILDDEKVQMMTFEEQRHLVMLLALRCLRPTEKMTQQQIAFRLRIDETFLKRLHETFLKHGFVAKDWSICNWNKRQYLSDSSTERVRRHRENKALKQSETFQNVSLKQSVTPPDTDTEQNRVEILIPKPRKRASGEMKHSTDPRHVACKAEIFAYYQRMNEGEDPDWDGQEGKKLAMFLSANPKVTEAGIRKLLHHRSKSQVNHSERPALWISKLKSYLSGPLDGYGKPLVSASKRVDPLANVTFVNGGSHESIA